MSGASVLIVEDDSALLRGLKDNFEAQGYRVHVARNGEEGCTWALANPPDLLLLDVMLPKMNGYQICRELRARQLDTAIIIITAKGQDEDIVRGLELGADDYVTKPFDMSELLARLKAAMRHGLQAQGEAPVFRSGPLSVDLVNRKVMLSGEEVHLSPKEFSLLRFLVMHAGRVVTHQQLLKEVWGPANVDDIQYLRVLMRQLRRKLEPESSSGSLLATEPGVGYRLLTLPVA